MCSSVTSNRPRRLFIRSCFFLTPVVYSVYGRPRPVPRLDQAKSGGPAHPGLAEALAGRLSRARCSIGAAYLSGLICLAVGTLVYRALSPRFAELV